MPLLPCPCCGYTTLSELNAYEICPVCLWEDDGQDNADADEVRGGPNYQWSLTQARLNFLARGISCPDRQDLRESQKDRTGFKRVRFFSISSTGKIVESK